MNIMLLVNIALLILCLGSMLTAYVVKWRSRPPDTEPLSEVAYAAAQGADPAEVDSTTHDELRTSEHQPQTEPAHPTKTPTTVTELLDSLGLGQRRRQRWQNDHLLRGLGNDSGTADLQTIKERDAAGNLRLQNDGNLWGSSLGGGMHAPILDLDFPHSYVPSKTEGHGHLYIHRPVSRKQLAMLLAALNRAGLMGDGNIHQFEANGQMFAACTTKAAVEAGETPIAAPSMEVEMQQRLLRAAQRLGPQTGEFQ